MNGDYDLLQKISFNITNLAFSIHYCKKPYLSDELQLLQHYVLKGAALTLKTIGYKHSSRFLDHSLQKEPSDITITSGDIIEDIQKNEYFKKKINEIINKNMTKYSFDTGTKKESLNFEHGDLFAALHSAYVDIIGNKNVNNNWDLDITLSDKYDFTEFKTIREYFEENDIMNFAATTGNNIAIDLYNI